MSILIKVMEMPTSCPCELLGIGYDLCCSFAGGIPARVKEYYECCQNGTRPSWCPLFHVPSHGRLIDADALINDHPRTWTTYDLQRIANAPTVIQADPSEEQREYEAAVEAAQYCEMHEPSYDPETGAL